jgi:chromatin remodeling complex protein RSC6
MVRTSKPTTAPAATAPTKAVPANTVTDAAPSAPVKKEKKAPKNQVVSASPAPPAPETTTTDGQDSDAAVSDDSSVASKLADFNGKLQQFVGLLSALKTQFKALEKDVNRELKASLKASSKKSKRSGNRQPSGFVRPTLISEELAQFLGKPVGTELARTAVSKEINKYIRDNNLQDKANGRQINADPKLTALLKLQSGDVLTYFNLQRYMKHHFIKQTPAATA